MFAARLKILVKMKKTKLILLAALLGGTIWSCAKPDEIEQPKKEEAYSECVDSSSEIKEATFGPQTGHPFSMENTLPRKGF